MILRIANITLWSLGLLGFLAFQVYALKLDGDIYCSELKIELSNKNDFPLLTSAEEIRTELLEKYLPIENQKKKNLPLKQIEKNAGQIAYLQKYNAYLYVNGILAINAVPRKAIMRVYNKSSQHFYLGADTIIMPLSSQHSLRLLLANGELPRLNRSYFDPSKNDTLNLPDIYKKIFILASKIQQDEFLNALIDQIYVKSNQEFELIPKAGVNFIEFGTIEEVDDKLKRLKIFYIKGKQKIDWTIYQSISLKYKNQVVCTKK